MCGRLASSGCEALELGRHAARDQGQHRFVAQDLNDAGLALPRAIASFDLVVALESIEQAKNPIRFLRDKPVLVLRAAR